METGGGGALSGQQNRPLRITNPDPQAGPELRPFLTGHAKTSLVVMSWVVPAQSRLRLKPR